MDFFWRFTDGGDHATNIEPFTALIVMAGQTSYATVSAISFGRGLGLSSGWLFRSPRERD